MAEHPCTASRLLFQEPAKSEFINISLRMLHIEMLKRSVATTFQQNPNAFNAVRVSHLIYKFFH